MKDKTDILKKGWVVAILAMVCCALWGSAFPCIKIGYRLFHIAADDTGSQVLFAGCRFFLAGVLTVIIGSLIEKRPLFPKRKAAGKIFKLSMLQTVIQYLFFYIGLAHTSGVKGAIIVGTNSLIAILIASLIFRQEKLTAPKLLGCLTGLCGVVIANLSGSGIDFDMSFLGEGFVLISVVSYAFSSVCLKIYSQDENPVMLSGWQFALGGVILSICGVLMGGHISCIDVSAFAMLFYLGFLSAVAYSLWGILLKVNPVSKVTIYGFMNPVIGVLLSALFLNEGAQAFSLKNMAALILVSAGIYAVNRKKPAQPERER